MTFLPDDMLVSGMSDGTIFLWNAHNGEKCAAFESEYQDKVQVLAASSSVFVCGA